jgi:hypothetical protein
MSRIYRYFVSLILVAGMYVQALAQENPLENRQDSIKQKVPLITGMRIEADAGSTIIGLLSGGEMYSYEGALQLYIQNKYYPVFEMGMAGADKVSGSGINYRGGGLYYRLGTDFNMMKSREGAKPTNNLLLVGARLGFSNFSYDLLDISFTDKFRNVSTVKNMTDINQSSFWLEISGGIRVELVRNVFLGWNIKYKNLINRSSPGEYFPYYIPGYGINSEGIWGFSYAIGYKF